MLWCFILALHTTAIAAPASPPTPVAQHIIETLRQTNQARAELSQEQQSWQLQRDQEQLMLADIERQIAASQANMQKLQRQKRTLEKSRSDNPLTKQVRRQERWLQTATQQIQQALSHLSQSALPGIIAPATHPIKNTALGAFEHAMQQLKATAKRGKAIRIELVSCRLQQQQLTVSLLRLGGAAAWWCALDGKRCGIARMQDSTLQCQLAQSARAKNAIISAFHIVQGQAPAELLQLPLTELATAQKAAP